MDLSDSPGGPAYPSRASGWVTHPPLGVSRVASDLLLQTCRRHYPGGTVAGIDSLPGKLRQRPSPWLGWVGSHITIFEACSAFTHVTACLLAGPPCGPFHRRLRRFCYLHRRSDCYRLERKLPGGIAPTEDRRLFTAHLTTIVVENQGVTHRPWRNLSGGAS